MFKNPYVFRIAAAGLKLQRLTNVKKFHMIFTDCIADLSTIERCGPLVKIYCFQEKKPLGWSLRNRHCNEYCAFLWFPKYFHFSTTFWVRHTARNISP